MSTDAHAGSAPVVEAAGLEKAYGELRALQGVSFSIPAGSVVGFLGPNGAGKTTAIKILTGYLAADAGSARICGHDIDADALAARACIGYLPENNPLYPEMQVDRFLAFAWAAQRAGATETRSQAIDRVVTSTGLESVYRRPIGACSKGFRQRVGLAQALLHDPPLLILDEPTNGLDPLQVVEIRELIRSLGRTKTILLTTHVLPEVEALAERVVLIHRGRKVADESLEALSEREGGRIAEVVVRGSAAALDAACAEAGAEVVQRRSAVFGDAGCVGVLVQLTGRGLEPLEALTAALRAQDLPVLELAPRAGGLEALFRGLQTAEAEAAA